MLKYELKERLNNLGNILKEDYVKHEITHEKDKSLKALFEVKKQFIQLMKTFVKEEWVDKY